MKKKAIVIVVICMSLLVVLSGCRDECETNEDCEGENMACEKGKCVSKGSTTNGLSAEFVQPGDTLYVEQEFNPEVDVKNNGEYTVSSGDAYGFLSGATWEDWELNTYWSKGLQAIRDVNEGVDLTELTEGGAVVGMDTFFLGNSLKVPEWVEGQTKKFTTTLCYPYETTATAQVVVGEPAAVEDRDKEIVPDSTKAPIKITKIEEITSSGESDKSTHTFKIFFENVGDGTPFETDKVGDIGQCINEDVVTRSDLNKYKIKELKLNDEMICKTGSGDNGGVQLVGKWRTLRKEGETVVTCTSVKRSGADLTGTLKVVLHYNYMQKFTKDVVIEK